MNARRLSSDHDKAHVQREYDRVSGEYERRWHRYVLRSVEETVRRARLEEGDRVLDVGCGTGALLRMAMT